MYFIKDNPIISVSLQRYFNRMKGKQKLKYEFYEHKSVGQQCEERWWL